MMMRRVVVLVGVVALALTSLNADAQRKKTKPDVSQGAAVTQTLGVDTQITIAYHRPGVKGRDVWTEKSDNENIGPLVPRDGDPRPWRSGANEATTIEVSGDVLVEGKELPAGKYALFMIPTDGDWTVVFSKQAQQWGAFGYKQKDDALRVTVTPVEAPHQEWLAYGFDDPGTWSATAYLRWNDVKIPFKIEVEEQE